MRSEASFGMSLPVTTRHLESLIRYGYIRYILCARRYIWTHAVCIQLCMCSKPVTAYVVNTLHLYLYTMTMLVRLSQARARADLREEVTADDAEVGMLIIYAY